MVKPGQDSLRPRIEGDREEEIFAAARAALAETGYDRLTMDAVALRARASKATLYRRWAGKLPLVIDALKETKRPPKFEDRGSLRENLIAAYCSPGGMTDDEAVDTLSAVITAMSHDEEFAEAFRAQVITPKLAAIRQVFDLARARGEIRADVDLDLIAPAVAGIVLHRYYVLGEHPTPALVAQVVDQLILPAVATRFTAPTHPAEAQAD